MRGRELFTKFKFIISILVFIFRLLPRFLKQFLYELFSSVPTRIGVLLRYAVLKSQAEFIGDNVYIARYVVIKNAHKLNIGNNVSVHEFCYIDAQGGVNIGNDVSIAHRSSIISFDHQYHDKSISIKYNPLFVRKIIISNDVWIGAGVTVLKGITIDKHVIVAAGAVVLEDLPSNHIYGGIPARELKEI